MERSRRLVTGLGLVFFVVLSVLAVRLAWLQTVTDAEARARQEAQTLRERTLPGRRGEILDRHGRVLASSTESVEAYVYPPNITTDVEGGTRRPRSWDEVAQSVATISTFLAPLVSVSEREIAERLVGDRTRRLGEPVRDPDGIDLLYSAKRSSGGERPPLFRIDLERDWSRTYPRGATAFNLVGWVGHDGHGASGLERGLDGLLAAVDGARLVQVDAGGRDILGPDVIELPEVPPVDGFDVVLTLDSALQRLVEERLAAALDKTEASGAYAVLLDPSTGDVLALASAPGLPPDDLAARVTRAARIDPVQTVYSPGSIFKPIMLAHALELGLVQPGESIDTSPRRASVYGSRVVSDTHPHDGHQTLEEILVNSSNIGMASILTRLVPADQGKHHALMAPVRELLAASGFGRRTGVPVPAECAGTLRPLEDWTRNHSLVSLSFGYEISVTALQMAGAVATFADGQYRVPRLVKGVLGPDGEVQEIPRAEPVRVWSPENAALVRGWLVAVVEDPEKRAAQVPGVRVAGKTGTAYVETDRNHEIHSFIALAPADDPVVALVVGLHDPHGGRYAAQTTAPVAGAILRDVLPYLGVPVGAAGARGEP